MKFFKLFFGIILGLCVIASASVSIENPQPSDKVRGVIVITWTDDNLPNETYSITATQDGWVHSVSIASSLPPSTRTYNWNTNSGSFPDDSDWEIKVERTTSSELSGTFTIDNTAPTSNLDIYYSGKIVVGETVAYLGDWSDNLTGPVEVVSAEIIASNTNNPSTATKICDINPPTVNGTGNSGTYSGEFSLTQDIVNAMLNYPYVWVKVVVQDQARDQNGEGNRVTHNLPLSEQVSVTISGYVRDYKGNAISNIPVILGGDLNLATTTNSSGYYSFNVTGYYFESSDSTYIGYYYIVPSIQTAVPSHMIYDDVYSGNVASLTNQNFIVSNGWRFKEYDLGNSNEYYFKTEGTLFTPNQLLLDWQIEKGGDILTGDIDNDGKLDLLLKSQSFNELSVYHYSGGYLSKFGITTSYLLGSIDEYDPNTGYLEILLVGTGQNALRIYDNTGSITPLHTITIPTAPSDTKWSARLTGYKKVLLAGSGTDYNKIILYDCETDSVIWEKSITDLTIEPDKISLVSREDSKVMVVFGGINTSANLSVYALDLFTGDEIWKTTFSGKRGKIRIVVSPISGVLYGDIIGILSDSAQSNKISVYKLSRNNGAIESEIPLDIYSSEFRYAVSDVDLEGVKEIILTDSNENLYVIDFSTASIENQMSSAGKLWACADIDGDNKKEIIVSSGGNVKVIKVGSLQTIMTYDLKDSINKLIVSDINNDGFLDIIATSSTKTYILRPMKSGENPQYSSLPSLPRPSLSASVDYEDDGAYNGIYLTWTYTLADDPRLVGFRIERSEDGVTGWTTIVDKTISQWNTGWDTGGREYNSSTGTYYYWYKDYPPHPYLNETYTYYYRVIAYNYVSNVYSTQVSVSFYSGGVSTGGGGCFIASVCFGANSWQVRILREFRDKVLVKNELGRKFVRFYYKNSPSIADYLRRHYILTIPVKLILYFVLIFVSLIISGILPYLVFTCCLWYLIKKLKT